MNNYKDQKSKIIATIEDLITSETKFPYIGAESEFRFYLSCSNSDKGLIHGYELFVVNQRGEISIENVKSEETSIRVQKSIFAEIYKPKQITNKFEKDSTKIKLWFSTFANKYVREEFEKLKSKYE